MRTRPRPHLEARTSGTGGRPGVSGALASIRSSVRIRRIRRRSHHVFQNRVCAAVRSSTRPARGQPIGADDGDLRARPGRHRVRRWASRIRVQGRGDRRQRRRPVSSYPTSATVGERPLAIRCRDPCTSLHDSNDRPRRGSARRSKVREFVRYVLSRPGQKALAVTRHLRCRRRGAAIKRRKLDFAGRGRPIRKP